jgi:hypothetical protein
MRRLVIYNLKECFTFGLRFKDLAELEQMVQTTELAVDLVTPQSLTFKFIQAKVDQSGQMTFYYEFKNPF